MENYTISYCGDIKLRSIHHIGIEYDGNYYSVIFGKYINGGFCCIPNWNTGCELSSNFKDIFWNTESISRELKSKRAARAIAEAIASYA